MPLRIANTRSDRIGVDFAGVTPMSLGDLSLDGVKRTQVQHGNRPVQLGELFTIDGNPRDIAWRLDGDFSAVHSLGAGMTAGEIVVDGPIGRHAGAQMQGGLLDVRGNAGDWLGAEMRGGAIRIRGDAGDSVGAAYLGSPRGMSGGVILIEGNAGQELGGRMRRGLIAVAGAAGEWAGARMLAGSIFVFGACGRYAGAAMRRGTLGLLGPRPQLLPTYRLACVARLPMLGLVQRQLHRESFGGAAALARLLDPIQLYHGDLLELGRGEILLAAADDA